MVKIFYSSKPPNSHYTIERNDKIYVVSIYVNIDDGIIGIILDLKLTHTIYNMSLTYFMAAANPWMISPADGPMKCIPKTFWSHSLRATTFK